MVVEEVINATDGTLIGGLIVEVGKLGILIQTLGILVVLWILFAVVTMYFNRKRRKLLEGIDSRLRDVEGKLDRVLEKKR
mgnify:CR=1 FL=1